MKFLDNFCRKIGVQHPLNCNSTAFTLDYYMHLCNTFLLCLRELPCCIVINITANYHSFIPALVYKWNSSFLNVLFANDFELTLTWLTLTILNSTLCADVRCQRMRCL